MIPVIIQSNVLFATTARARLTILFVDALGCPDRDDDSFSSMYLLRHPSFPFPFFPKAPLILLGCSFSASCISYARWARANSLYQVGLSCIFRTSAYHHYLTSLFLVES